MSKTESRRRLKVVPNGKQSAPQAELAAVLRVLIVEDSEGDAALMARVLSDAGHRLETRRVTTEAAFRDALANFHPDLVLCDYMVPGFGGVTALEILRSERPELPCIFVSGTLGEEKAVEILKSGADDFVLKSAMKRLPRVVERARREREAQRQLRLLQQALAESEERFRSLTELSADWYWEQDAEHRFTGLSGSYFAGKGVRETPKVGKRRWELPEYRLSEAEWARYRGYVEARQPFRDLEFRYVVGDETFRVSISGEPVFDAEGRFRGYRGVGRDVTGRKLAEESLRRFRAAMDASGDSIFIVDPSLRILDVNRTACESTGYTREELLSMTADRLMPRFSRDEVQRGFREAIARLPETFVFETELLRKDGSELPVDVYRRAVESEDGHVVLGIARDITNQRRMFEQLRVRNEQQSAVAALGAYALEEKDLAAVMNRAVRDVSRVLGVEFARVLERVPDGRSLVLRAAAGWPAAAVGTMHVEVGRATHAGYTLEHTQGIVLADLRTETRFAAEALKQRGIVSGIGVVIRGHGAHYGVLDAHSRSPREFSGDDSNFMTAVANVLAAAIERRRSELSLRLRERALEASVSAVIITNAQAPDHPIEYVNPAFERITGYRADEAIGRNCRFLQWNDHSQPGLEAIRSAIRTESEAHTLLRNYTRDGRLFWNELHIAPVRDDTGTVTHFIGIQNDVTESRRYQEQLEHQATHDELTGLPNRNLLRDRLTQAILMAQRSGHQVVVAFVDLDHFKYINDSLGHATGDRVLQSVSARISSCLREGDTVARVGGDEFVLVLADHIESDFAAHAMRRISERIAEPVEVDGREFHLSCSIGLSVFPRDGRNADALLKHADVAMYRAKEQGRNAFVFYSEEMNEGINERIALEASLRRALAQQQFQLHFQPRVNLESGLITGAEALIRWNHPDLGLVSPNRFIALAEELGLIGTIGEWVLQTACRHLSAWRDKGLRPLVMAVNLSARQMSDPRLVDSVAQILNAAGVDGSWLELEITESTMMRNPRLTEQVLADLHELGVAIAIDDFGTGYSSLSYLKNFRIDCLKIDQSFVRGLPDDKDDFEITRAIVALARSMRMRVIAEGIEREEQRAFLSALGCEEAQGYLFSKPVAAPEFRRLLEANRPLGESAA